MNWRSTTFTYTRQRRFFGQQPLFSDRYEMILDIAPDQSIMKDHVLQNPVLRETQLSKQFGSNVLNTDNVKLQNRGMCHTEGGWPKDVNFTDEEAATRYRKKIEREQAWQDHVCNIEKPLVKAIFQNNAISIYENYINDMEILKLGGSFNACVVNEFRDPIDPVRQISNIMWKPNDQNIFVAVYGFSNLHAPTLCSYDNFIWDIGESVKAIGCLKAPSCATCINWNPRDTHILSGALRSGAVCNWDARTGEHPVAVCPLEASHKDVCSALTWVQCKSNTEFYSGSIDGTIHFWDVRNLSQPFSIFMLGLARTDVQDIQRAHGCTVLEFEYTIPIRFMAATDKGHVFLGNRKAAVPSDVIIGSFQAMSGPIRNIERNPFYVKYFLVIGNWSAKVWTEECKYSPLTRCVNQKAQLSCGTWSQSRCSLYFTGREDGKVDFWDLLLDQKEPIYSLNVFQSPITAIKSNYGGKLLAVGTQKGDVSLIQLDESLTCSGRNDRMLLSAVE